MYPCTLDEDDQYFIKDLLPPMRTRLRAIELIDSFSDLWPHLESAIEQCEVWLEELREKLAEGPFTLPIVSAIQQLDKEVA
jgi:hypothetical protein